MRHRYSALVTGIFITGYACSSRSPLPGSSDASAASTGGAATGGALVGGASGVLDGGAGGRSAGGAGGATGVRDGGAAGTAAGGNTGSGYGGHVDDSCPVYVSYNPFCGKPPTGGNTIIGVSGGGGSISAGGTTSSGGITGLGGNTSAGDAGADLQGCACGNAGVAWDCYCHARDCNKTLNGYVLEAGTKKDFANIREYADCGYIVVETMLTDEVVREVYSRSTWRLVGEEIRVPAALTCPPSSSGIGGTLKAGEFPAATCVQSRCTEGRLADSCGGVGGARG
jgi:hypothetical protein